MKYVCTVCGFVYDEEVGDPDNGIAPGTKFEDLPDDYLCPWCGQGKEVFVKEQCMKVAIRYFTKSKKGNTFKLARAVSEAIDVPFLTVNEDLKEKVDILFLVNAMYAATIDKEVKRFLIRNKEKISLLVNVNSAASGKSTLKAVKKVSDKVNIPVSDKEYHTVASWLSLNKGRPNEDDLNRLKEFAISLVKQR